MSAWLLVVTALIYLAAGGFAMWEGNDPMAYVLWSFFLSNMALAYAAQS